MTDPSTLRCLIVEDEPIAAEVLEDYIAQVAFLKLHRICSDAIFALEEMQTTQVDVLFLDIHLPKLKGLDFLRTLVHRPQTILTTAYHQYALPAFEEGVIDYLLKPIEFSRFLKAVNKLDRRPVPNYLPEENKSSRPFRFFNVNKRMVRVFIDEILYIESLKDYSRIVTPVQELVTRIQIGELEEHLAPFHFLRIHRSYLVPCEHVQAFSSTQVEIAQKILPIGRSYKELVNRKLREYFGM